MPRPTETTNQPKLSGAQPFGLDADAAPISSRHGSTMAKAAVAVALIAAVVPSLAQARFLNGSADSGQGAGQEGAVASAFLLTREGATYRATPGGGGTTYTGTLKLVMESAARDLRAAGGGTMTFATGTFDFGSDRFVGANLENIAILGQGIDATVLQNVSNAAADSEPFDMHDSNRITIRDMTVIAGGSNKSTSDAIDFDGGNDVLIERVKVAGSRGRGIVFDGKDLRSSLPRTADRNVVRDCIIAGVPSDGIELLASNDNTVEGCTVTDVGGHGIQMAKAGSGAGQPNKKSNGNTIVGNFINNSGQDGINVTSGDRNEILGNEVLNSSDDATGRDGVRIASANSITCDANSISGNTLGDNQTTATQRYGLNIASAVCNQTVVGDNTFFGNRLGAINDRGTGTRFETPVPDTTSPSAPTNLTATAVGANQVDLNWTASTDNIGVSGYDVYRNASLLDSVGAVTTYSDPTASPSTSYTYQVRARDAAGNVSGFSNAASATTPPVGGAEVFSDDFETGTFAAWSANTGLVAQQEEVFAGSWAARGTTTSRATWAYKQLGSTYTELHYRIRFKVLSQGATTLNLLKVRTSTGTSILGLYRSSSGNLGYRNDVAGAASSSTTPVSTGVWHTVQVRILINGTAGETETWLDGVRIAALSKAQNLGTAPIGRLQIGENSTGRTFDVAIDDVAAATVFIA
jgi:chitodextrinase